MKDEPRKTPWNLKRGVVALIVTSVLLVGLRAALMQLTHMNAVFSTVIATTFALSITGWLLRSTFSPGARDEGRA